MTELRTRKPTGRAPWPFVLAEGVEKGGKTYAALALSASPRVGRTFAFDLSEGSLDEYKPLGPFEIVDHDGSYRDFLEQLEAAIAVPSVDGKPNVIVIDTMSALWAALCDEANDAARRSKAGKRILAADPDAEVPVTMDKWNIAKRKWRRVVDLLMSYHGIVVVTARGKEVAEVENGRPVEGHKTWKVEAEKSLTFDASCIVRWTGPQVAHLVGVRSLTVTVPEGKTLPLPRCTLDDLIFNKLGLTAENTEARRVTVATADTTEQDRAWFEQWKAKAAAAPDEAALRAMWDEIVERHRVGGLPDEARGDASRVIAVVREQIAAAQVEARREIENKARLAKQTEEQDAAKAAALTRQEELAAGVTT